MDLTADPPFTRLDLVSCRNTLIYLQAHAQERVLRRFQYSIGPGGWLFLGSSESLGAVGRDFEVIDNKAKVFQCSQHAPLPLEIGRSPSAQRGPQPTSRRARRAADVEAARASLMDRYLPPSILVNEERTLLHVFGDVTGLLQVPSGGTNLDLSRMLPPRLSSVAISVLMRALKAQGAVHGETRSADGHTLIRVEGNALPEGPDGKLVVLSFISTAILAEHAVRRSPEEVDTDVETARRIRELEDEVNSTRDNLQATIEELEASNEELQAANEELLASNEELQSTNEELQSVNEELYTVNAEHQEKIEILRQINADLDVMARATAIPMLFLDQNLHITRYTPSMTGFVALTSTDIGRPLEHFTIRLDAPWLIESLRGVVDHGERFEREVRGASLQPSARHFLVRGLPYRSGERGDPAVALTILDVTDIEQARARQSVLDALVQHVAVVDASGRIELVNQAWTDFARRNGDPHLRGTCVGADYLAASRQATEATPGALHDALVEVLSGERQHFRTIYPCHAPQQRRFFAMDAIALQGGGAVISHMEITPWVDEADVEQA